ncbi:PREDICTED: probable cytochrome P450 6a13 [Nicrophorus vespilloides]|uniref:Probable cytochrome P450 6a13 n=1 Tax=Nicrophorus vespilloides TaxID=110193 RepID=A0ABM1M4B8_NICVS|nr:PREDICTED: probable cytochrome P450 6a13 [Nicrophorus vespilloides]
MLVAAGALAFTALLLVYIYYKDAHRYWERRGVATFEPRFPFGNVFTIVFRKNSINDKVCELYRTMKAAGHRYAGLYFFSRKVLVILDPQLVKCVLSKDFSYFNDRGIHYDEINDPLSAHLFSLSGGKWKTLRTKLTPAFTAGKTKFMFEPMLHCTEQMATVIGEQLAISSTVEIKDILARFTTDVIGCCAFGIDCNSLSNPDAEFRRMGRRAFTQTPMDTLKMVVIRSFPQLAKIFQLGVFAKSVSDFFQSVVEDTVRYRKDNSVERNDFLQLLMQMMSKEGAEALTMNEAAAQAFIFFLAGFETTSTTISFALMEMSMNPTIRNQARSELLRVLEEHDNKITYETVSDLRYMESIVLESLRKYPPAPVFLRKCTKSYKIPDSDVIIEEGLSVLIPAMALHMDPEYHPDPEIFDPNRFANKLKDYAYIPFGDGPRICIGMRFAMVLAKLALAVILQRFDFELSAKTKLPLEMEKKGIVLAPIGGIWLEFSAA